MHVALVVVANDGFVVISGPIGLDIDTERAIDLQLEAAGTPVVSS